MKQYKIILGLGNPPEQYHHTYHNIGFLFADYLAETFSVETSFRAPSKKHFECIDSGNFILAKTLTYMNESGKAAREILDYFNISPEHLLVVHDDSDMVVGTYKQVFAQNSGGHKGVESVIRHLGTKEFWRLKIGIRPQREWFRKKAAGFVTKNIRKKDEKVFKEVFEEIKEEVLTS